MKVSPELRPGSKIFLVGEAPGASEEALGLPFKGAAGQELSRMLRDVGLSLDECSISNVFSSRPAGNNVELFFTNKKEGAQGLLPLKAGKYLQPQFLPELARLKEEISSIRPNLIIPLGATASWATCSQPKISNIRGTVLEASICQGKALPTYHPAAVLRQWELRPIVLADLMKARAEMDFPEIRRIAREIHIAERVTDIADFVQTYLTLDSASPLAFDIETRRGQITMISFAQSPTRALVVPFISHSRPDFSYWSQEDEVQAWNQVRQILSSPCPKLGQNGLYDLQYLWKIYGIPVKNYLHDTMLLHYALQPEMQKSLGFLGSIYCNEAAWKEWRKHKEEEEKAEE